MTADMSNQAPKAVIHLQDATGRTILLPFEKVKEWTVNLCALGHDSWL
jgi:hypothetical protein